MLFLNRNVSSQVLIIIRDHKTESLDIGNENLNKYTQLRVIVKVFTTSYSMSMVSEILRGT